MARVKNERRKTRKKQNKTKNKTAAAAEAAAKTLGDPKKVRKIDKKEIDRLV